MIEIIMSFIVAIAPFILLILLIRLISIGVSKSKEKGGDQESE